MTEWNKKRRVMSRYNHSASVYNRQYAVEQEAKIKAALNELKLKKGEAIFWTRDAELAYSFPT